jgi:uncharacterized protein
MAAVSSYRHGTPNWVDVSSTDLAKTKAFYKGLFGWDALDFGADAGNYGFFLKDGKDVAGFGPTMGGAPPARSTFIKVDDVDAVAAKIPENGGTVLAGPFDLPNESGRMAYIVDPAGAYYGVYQPKQHKGAALANEEGAFVWNELCSRDIAGSLAFLTAVVGNECVEMEGSDGHYFLIKAGGRTVAGAMPMGDMFPKEVPSHWATYIMTDLVDEKAAMVQSLGGSVVVPPSDMPNVGYFAVLSDCCGATFSIIRISADRVDDPNA